MKKFIMKLMTLSVFCFFACGLGQAVDLKTGSTLAVYNLHPSDGDGW